MFAAFRPFRARRRRSSTLQKLEQAGQLASMSERAIEDETRNAERLYQVVRVASGALEAPLFLLLGGSRWSGWSGSCAAA